MAYPLMSPAYDLRYQRTADDGLRGPSQRGVRPATQNGSHALQIVQTADSTGDASSSPTPQRKNVVIADPVAFRYLEDDSCVTVVERRTTLCGYESYLVEQWACSRQSPTLVVVTYTGDEKHSVVVGILSVPADENVWPVKLRVYFKAIQKFHARPKDTSLGELMVTNLSSFPSALTVILVPNGDIRKYRHTFIINEDLKRLGCSGRSGLSLTDPAEATQAKFQELYRTSDRVPFSQAVLELIKLCQVALYLFEKLGREYIDGLLCDMTETAINNWWTEVGAEHYNFEPTDGILGPSTVSALLGMLMGARNRLHWFGAPVSKDVFDIESTKRGIGSFQKSQKLEKTRRLDRPTILKLYSVTAKAAAGGEGWGVQRAVKSTVTEIGGKRGELVMGMVSGKDKGGLADIETLNFDSFVSLAYGERAKWLWHGKPRRTVEIPPDRSPDMSNATFWKEENMAPMAKSIAPPSLEDEAEAKPAEEPTGIYSAFPPGSATSFGENQADRDAIRKNVFKSVAGNARSGFGRFKDAVGGGLRGHNARPSVSAKEDFTDTPYGSSTSSAVPMAPMIATAPPGVGVNRAFTWNKKPEEYLAAVKRGEPDALPGLSASRFASTSTVDIRPFHTPADECQRGVQQEGDLVDLAAEVRKKTLSNAPSAVGSLVDDSEAQDSESKVNIPHLGLVRRHSILAFDCCLRLPLNETRWPRRMSFSDAEDAVLAWEPLVNIEEPAMSMEAMEALGELARHFHGQIGSIQHELQPWVTSKVKALGELDDQYARNKTEIEALYQQLSEACQRVQVSSDELIGEERAHLTEGLREIEALVSRLDYEINALRSKVTDVEDGIMTFEKQVGDMEKRAEALKVQLETETWLHWMFRTITGIGTGPDITRALL